MVPLLATLGTTAQHLDALRGAVPDLHGWYSSAARDLPWRRTRDPYAIWVSEVMLQQTRAATVVPYFERWMQAFPTPAHLAEATVEQVLMLWEGLGYYSRARNLHRAAGELVARFGGRVPDDPDRFRALPGVGTYTVAAVMSIAFGRDLAALDGNVRRVLCRLVALEQDPRGPGAARALELLAAALLPPGAAAAHNQAMMELGATLCTPRNPACATCPLGPPCMARPGDPRRYPVKRLKAALPHHQVAIGLVQDRQGRVLIQRRPYQGLLGGLWEFPGGKLEPGESPEQALHRELFEEQGLQVEITRRLPPVHHAYTHFKVTLHPMLCTLLPGRVAAAGSAAEGQPTRWVRPSALGDHPMPRANRKVLELLARAARPGLK